MAVQITRDALIAMVALVVTAIWGFAACVSVITRDPTVLGVVTPVMVIVVGGLMALLAKQNGKGNRNGHAA